MHLVSNVKRHPDRCLSAKDVVRATFPAGTLSGAAPKIRAMEIIRRLETVSPWGLRRAVGYLSYTGNMDLAIGHSYLVTRGETMHVQAGAGIVAASQPEANMRSA